MDIFFSFKRGDKFHLNRWQMAIYIAPIITEPISAFLIKQSGFYWALAFMAIALLYLIIVGVGEIRKRNKPFYLNRWYEKVLFVLSPLLLIKFIVLLIYLV